MSKRMTVSEVATFLSTHDNFTLLSHASPDGDTIGASYALGYALKQLNKKVKVLCSDKIPTKFLFLTNTFNHDETADETIVSLDVADTKLLGSLEDEYKGKIELAIDHHVSNREFSANLLLDADASAACEIVYDILIELGVQFDRQILDALYTGIITDTGCFKFSNTTARTHIIAADLISRGVDYAEINRIMFDTKSRARVKIEGAVMDKMEYHFGGRVSFITITREMLSEAGCDDSDLDGINALSRTIEGVMVGITVREKESGKYKISLRTNAPIDASKVCAKFGGGGHIRAAGCEFGCTIEEVKEELLLAVKAELEEMGCLI